MIDLDFPYGRLPLGLSAAECGEVQPARFESAGNLTLLFTGPPRSPAWAPFQVAAGFDPNDPPSFRRAPGVIASLDLVSGSQIRRYNFETLLLTQEVLKGVVESFSSRNRSITGHFIEVSFDLLPDKTEREYFKRLPTSFTLTDTQVDRLKEVGRTILRNSPAFQAMLRAVSDPEE